MSPLTLKRTLTYCLTLSLLLSFTCSLSAGPRDKEWKEVNEAIKKGLPKTAIEKLKPIIEAAVKEKAYPEAIRAISQRIALEGNIQGNKPEEKVTRMQEEIKKAPAEMKPMMNAILANWYWHYYLNNRWRFMQRTQTSAPPGDDFTTWDLPRIFREIDKQFQVSLKDAKTLQKIKIEDYEELLVKGNAPANYRPTLYDFLVHNALAFYSSGEQAAVQSEDEFELLAESPILSSVGEFLKWKPETTDTTSPTFKAVLLYQDVLRFHSEDKNRAAFWDADLHRLNFGYSKAYGDEKSARYKSALKSFADKTLTHPICNRAFHHLAQVIHQEGDFVKARDIALQGMTRYPHSIGRNRCTNLFHQIEQKQVQINVERVWNHPSSTIDVRYKNVTKVYFRIVSYDFNDWLKTAHTANVHQQRVALLNLKPVKSWSIDLPATDDYQQRLERIPAPDDLEPGFYYLIASHNENFDGNKNQVSCVEFWRSDLALVIRTRHGEDLVEGFVLDARTGEPIPNAKVKSWHRPQYKAYASLHPEVKTDKNGLFHMKPFTGKRNLYHPLFLAEADGQRVSSMNYFYFNKNGNKPKPYMRTIFFTDRALYRPGQTIHYKGICVAVDHNQDSYETLADRNVTVLFRDVNGKEIEKQQHRTNAYGSFSGSVTAPRDRLMGQMSLRVESPMNGYAAVRVEEYKRPKFQVKLEPPKEAPRLKQQVKLSGKATAYTGAAIDGAKVRWRVVREVRYPIWWGWRYWWRSPQSNSREIAHGRTKTDTSGSFNISFEALPDLAVSEDDEPTFHYSVHADVIDTTGETRSDERTIRIGYTALSATVSTDEWLEVAKPIEATVRTTTLDGENQSAEGKLIITELIQPEKVQRDSLANYSYHYYRNGKAPAKSDPSNPNSWKKGKQHSTLNWKTGENGTVKLNAKLKEGYYKLELETQDRFGKPVRAERTIRVLNPKANKLALKVPSLFTGPRWTLEPGEEFMCLWGSGYDSARAYIEVEHRRKIIQSFWTKPNVTQLAIKQKITEKHRGGFTVRVTMVRENRAYLYTRNVHVPWTNKKLSIQWEHFVSKLEPAQKETWTATVSGPDAAKAVAEMVATLYDASLDAYLPHVWQNMFHVFRVDRSNLSSQFENGLRNMHQIYYGWNYSWKESSLTYHHLPGNIIANFWGYGYFGRDRNRNWAFDHYATDGAELEEQAKRLGDSDRESLRSLSSNGSRRKLPASPLAGKATDKLAQQVGQGGENKSAGPNLDDVSARKNLSETAFFLPHLMAKKNGTVQLTFTMPESVTKWRFLGFAHDRNLRGGLLTDKVITAKELMVQPNPPRFLREGDLLEFTVKVSNQSAGKQSGKVRLTFADARTGENVDALLKNIDLDQSFEIPAGESRSFSWKLNVPDDLGFLTYKAVGSTGKLSDGEEAYLPVLSRRMLVSESLPLPIRGKQTKTFEFTKLLDSGKSKTLKHQSLTVQMVSNPSWYAVMALPYLMEYPHQCAEQTFNRLYANSIAQHIAQSDPKIRRTFDIWKNSGKETLDSPLHKNQDLKSVMIEETPWLRDADKESQARRNVGILFDENRLSQETKRALHQLKQMQYADGAWPWFPGGPPNDYITLYITTGFGRMRHLGVKIDVSSAVKSLTRLDGWADRRYREILRHGNPELNHLSTTIALYLYGRSFFLKDKPIAKQHQEAVNYWIGQARKYWLQLAHRQSQAHLAVALKRFDDLKSAQGIMNSIRERSVSDEELGMFWRDTERSWWWYRAPIETQAMMIEAFDEVMNDQKSVEECRVWLLKQKQTQNWKTTKATADAIYGLLLRGTDILASDALVEVSLGKEKIEPEDVEAGTGFYEQKFVRKEITPEQGKITVKKIDDGVAWGSVHWQYLEDMSKITPYEGTPLKLTKQLYTKVHTTSGPTLQPVKKKVSVGDELVVRVVLRTDRDMEYVHLKDYRGSGTEPVNVLSQYKHQDGLWYYESTRDTASHFFIDYLPKGTYVFEYSVRVQHRGTYQTGFASIQCMYAPEFGSHSESLILNVK